VRGSDIIVGGLEESSMFDYFQRLLRYTVWANRRVLKALQDHAPARTEGLPLFAHVLAGEHLWMCRLRNVAPRLAPFPQLTLEECAVLLEENAAAYVALLDELGPAGLAKPFTYRTLAGVEYTSTLADILTHVVTHGGYHRGQVAKALGRSGMQAVNTDFIMFTRDSAA
jgi:uncharacterized damage-inducible protein DinB